MKGKAFAQARKEDLPPWLDDEQGRGWSEAQGAQQDAELALLEDSLRQRYPLTCDDSALDDVGYGFGLDRFKNESHASYRGRLGAAWQSHELRGAPAGVTSSLEGWGLGPVLVIRDYELPGMWPGDWYSRFKVLVGPDFGDFGALWSPSADEKNAMISQILDQKALHGLPVDIQLRYEGDLIGIDFVIGTSTIGGAGETVVVMPLIGVSFEIGVDKIGVYKEY